MTMTPSTAKHQRPLAMSDLLKWRANRLLEKAVFGESGYQRLTQARKSTKADELTIVSVAWEHPWAKSGGVAAIARSLPAAIQATAPGWARKDDFPRVLRIAPLHERVFTGTRPPRPVETAEFRFGRMDVQVEIYELRIDTDVWHLLRDPSGTYLQADGGSPSGTSPDGSPRNRSDPYFYSKETTPAQRDSLDSCLLRDSLFFAKAVPAALVALGHSDNLIVHAHDWTASALALTVKEEMASSDGKLGSALVAYTFHNPFDHLVRGLDRLAAITAGLGDPKWVFPFQSDTGMERPMPDTLLECMIGLFDGPIAIVSPGFAAEVFGENPLQRVYFAPHLQNPLAYQGCVGIQNANFYPKDKWRPFSQDAITDILKLDSDARILEEKQQRQKDLIAVLGELKSNSRIRVTGSLDTGDRGLVYFHMAGRFDPAQKGFDVLGHAIQRYLVADPQARARFILTPLVTGLEPLTFYHQLENLARVHSGKVMMVEGFLDRIGDVQAGATWSLWPSLYEPCGGATEPLAMGTPVIARETGGLSRQVTMPANQSLVCGLLYREKWSDPDAGQAWKAIETTPDPATRLSTPLYESMVQAMVERIVEAVRIRIEEPKRYARLLACTTLQVQDEFFSLERFGKNYWTLYQAMLNAADVTLPTLVV